MQPIILIDHESNELFIAEVKNKWDIKKIEKENKKLDDEYFNDTYDNRKYSDYYDELSYRTGIDIYKPTTLYI